MRVIQFLFSIFIVSHGVWGIAQDSGTQPTGVISSSQPLIRFGYDVEPEKQALIRQDLQSLLRLSLFDQSFEMQRILKLSGEKKRQIESSQIGDWLRPRTSWIIGERLLSNLDRLKVIKENVKYPNFEGPNKPDSLLSNRLNNENESVVMVNMGSALYQFAKDRNVIVGVDLESTEKLDSKIKPIVITSPRVGIFQIGEGFFSLFLEKQGHKSLQDRIYSFFRLSTLLHEARHTDGRGPTAMFMHSECPFGHDYQGSTSCDTPSNGPYRLDALFLEAAQAGARDLQSPEKEAIELMRLDMESRILTPFQSQLKVKTTDKSSKLCEFLREKNISAFFCKEKISTEQETTEWDDTPEQVELIHDNQSENQVPL